jgi:hypothetical protein
MRYFGRVTKKPDTESASTSIEELEEQRRLVELENVSGRLLNKSSMLRKEAQEQGVLLTGLARHADRTTEELVDEVDYIEEILVSKRHDLWLKVGIGCNALLLFWLTLGNL